MTDGDTPAQGAPPPPRTVAGKIGMTMLCLYLIAVSIRIDGCYHSDAAPRDEAAEAGPRVGTAFPAFDLPDVSGARVTLHDLAGRPAIVAFVPSLDWSAPTKARVLDLGDAVTGRRDLTLTIVMTAPAATARSRVFVREHDLPAYVLVDAAGLVERAGLQIAGPENVPVAMPATFVLDANGTVVLRDVRHDARTWLDPRALLAAARVPAERAS